MTTDQQFISRLTEIILENIRDENFGVRGLARLTGIDRSVLNHRLHSTINKNTNQFIREVRLQKALELLKNENITASEAAYKVGFSSPAYFNKCFHEFFGYPPGKVEKIDSGNHESISITGYTSQVSGKKDAKVPLNIRINTILILAVLILVIAVLIYLKMVN